MVIPPRALRTEQARWDRLARDPYYAVINTEANRDGRMTDDARRAFVESGIRDVSETLDDIRRWVTPDFHPRRAIDFGCGVGRLTIPLADACGEITGIDISETMLVEARRNAAAAGVEHARFVTSNEFFSRPAEQDEPVDLVHAFIVFQHIPPRTGLWLADQLLDRLRVGGVAALHFTYARRASALRRTVNALRRYVPGTNALVNLVQGRPALEPFIPMNNYDPGALYALFSRHGCGALHARLTDHGGHLGAMFIFQKERADKERARALG